MTAELLTTTGLGLMLPLRLEDGFYGVENSSLDAPEFIASGCTIFHNGNVLTQMVHR